MVSASRTPLLFVCTRDASSVRLPLLQEERKKEVESAGRSKDKQLHGTIVKFRDLACQWPFGSAVFKRSLPRTHILYTMDSRPRHIHSVASHGPSNSEVEGTSTVINASWLGAGLSWSELVWSGQGGTTQHRSYIAGQGQKQKQKQQVNKNKTIVVVRSWMSRRLSHSPDPCTKVRNNPAAAPALVCIPSIRSVCDRLHQTPRPIVTHSNDQPTICSIARANRPTFPQSKVPEVAD